MKHGKKYVDSRKAVDASKQYASEEALGLVCENAKAKFDETVVQLYCRTALVRLYGFAYSARKISMKLLRQLVLISLAVRISLTRSPRKTGWILTL